MRFYIFFHFLFFFFLLPVLGQGRTLHPPIGATLNVRWNEDPPYTMTNSDGKIVGIDADLIRETLHFMGYKVKFRKMPFARGLAYLKSGDIDILSGVFIKPDRRVYAFFSEAVFSNRNVLFQATSSYQKWNFQQLSDLKGSGFRLGVQIGVSYGNDFDVLLKDTDFVRQLHPVGERIQLLKMTAKGRIDGFIADELTGKYEISQLGMSEQILMSKVIVSEMEDEPVGVAFSKKTVSPGFVDLFNKAQQKMIDDGTTQRILEKYR